MSGSATAVRRRARVGRRPRTRSPAPPRRSRGARATPASTRSGSRRANYHVTLKFLGWTRAERSVAVARRARARASRGTPRFELRTARLGAFRRSTRRPWCGPASRTAPALTALAGNGRRGDGGARLPAETRPFHAARDARAAARNSTAIKEVVLPLSEQMFSGRASMQVILFESETKPSWFGLQRNLDESASNSLRTQVDRRQTSDGRARPGREPRTPMTAGHGDTAKHNQGATTMASKETTADPARTAAPPGPRQGDRPRARARSRSSSARARSCASARIRSIARSTSIPTGSLGLDIALGIGGLPRGRIVEIYGPESSGKTTLTLHIVAEAQKRGGVCAFIDAEHALDVDYAKKLGVKTEELLVSPAGLRRAGARDRRHARALERGRRRSSSTRSPR